MFWTDKNVLDMVQNVKFSSEKMFLVRSKIIWMGPKYFWTYLRTRHNKRALNALQFKHQNLKSCKHHEKGKKKNRHGSPTEITNIRQIVFCFVLFFDVFCRISNSNGIGNQNAFDTCRPGLMVLRLSFL